MARYTITPWKHPSDLLTVRQQLYRLDNDSDGTTPDHRRHAVDRIQAWKLRSNLPHAVESTALLIDAQLHHQNATTNPSAADLSISEFSLRAVYAAAFTRFVTGFCDIGRSRERGLEQSSMLAIAKQIGMPADFVTLRHEAVHEELPGLRRLIGAVERALEWLWEVYWGRLEVPVVAVAHAGKQLEVKTEVGRILRGYRKERRDALKGRSADSGELLQRTSEEILSLGSSRESGRLIVTVLIEERLLLPTSRTIGEPLDGAYMIWDEMLSALNQRASGFSEALLTAIFREITKIEGTMPQNDAEKEALALWTLHILQTIGKDRQESVMQLCCLSPGYWTQWIGERVLEAGDDELSDAWETIFAASCLQGAGEEQESAGEREMGGIGDAMDVEAHSGEVGGSKWTRGVIPPALPIGVVR